jgi:16S rRNA processing protein RimM
MKLIKAGYWNFMENKFVGTIVQVKSQTGSLSVEFSGEQIEHLPENTIVKIGYSHNFTRDYSVESWKGTKKGAIIKLRGIDNHESAAKLLEQGVFINEDTLRQILADYMESVSGVVSYEAIDANTRITIGTVKLIYDTPAHEVYVIKTPNGDLPIPAVDVFINKIDKKNKIIFINMIDGIEDLIE